MEAVGIDMSIMLISQGKNRNPDLPLLAGDAGSLPLRDSSCDGLLLECTLSLVPDQTRVLRECHRVLKHQGRLMITDIYARNPQAIVALRALPIQSCLRGALDRDQFIRECSDAGFVMDSFEDHSELLTDFAAQIIWTYGSFDVLCCGTGSRHQGVQSARCAIKDARPGYFLCLGFKDGDPVEANEKREKR